METSSRSTVSASLMMAVLGVQLVPVAVQVHAEIVAGLGNHRLPGRNDLEGRLDVDDELGQAVAVQVLDRPVVGHDVELVLGEDDGQEKVVLLLSRVAGVFGTAQLTHPAGGGAAMVSVGHVQARDGFEQYRQALDQCFVGDDPEGVGDTVVRDKVVFRRDRW